MNLHLLLLRSKIYRYISNRIKGVPASVLNNAGAGFYCGRGSFFRPGEDIKIGNNVYMGVHTYIASPCLIKDDVMLASYVALVGGDHRFDQPGVLMKNSGRGLLKRIVIEEDVWIGHGAIILGGRHIGRGAIIGAGSIVTKDIPPCTIWAGNPAVYIRDRFNDVKDREAHLNFLTEHYR